MPEFAALIEGYRRFRLGSYREQRERYDRLAQGQSPKVLVIACSDSRVDPGQIFDVAPGELFVVRNVAALVPPCESTPGLHGTSAAIEFAVDVLGVRTVLVMGHARCGGLAAAIKRGRWPTAGARASFIDEWIDLAAPAVEALPADADAAQELAERRSIELSLDRLTTFPFVARRVAEGSLNLEGARFDIASGSLDLYNTDRGWVRA